MHDELMPGHWFACSVCMCNVKEGIINGFQYRPSIYKAYKMKKRSSSDQNACPPKKTLSPISPSLSFDRNVHILPPGERDGSIGRQSFFSPRPKIDQAYVCLLALTLLHRLPTHALSLSLSCPPLKKTFQGDEERGGGGMGK